MRPDFLCSASLPGDGDMVTDGMKARVQAFQAFCSLISSTELVVVQKIIFSYLGRGEIGHDHICPGKDPLFPAVFCDGAQRCGGGQQDFGKHETDQPQHEDCEFQRPGGWPAKGVS